MGDCQSERSLASAASRYVWSASDLRLRHCSSQEYQENNSNIILENVEINQVVNIYGCKNSVIQVKGKVNAINLSQSF